MRYHRVKDSALLPPLLGGGSAASVIFSVLFFGPVVGLISLAFQLGLLAGIGYSIWMTS